MFCNRGRGRARALGCPAREAPGLAARSHLPALLQNIDDYVASIGHPPEFAGEWAARGGHLGFCGQRSRAQRGRGHVAGGPASRPGGDHKAAWRRSPVAGHANDAEGNDETIGTVAVASVLRAVLPARRRIRREDLQGDRQKRERFLQRGGTFHRSRYLSGCPSATDRTERAAARGDLRDPLVRLLPEGHGLPGRARHRVHGVRHREGRCGGRAVRGAVREIRRTVRGHQRTESLGVFGVGVQAGPEHPVKCERASLLSPGRPRWTARRARW